MSRNQSQNAGRRPKGSGSFWYSASEKRWRATYRDARGQRRTLSAGSKAEIMRRLGEVQYGSTRASGRQRKPSATTLSSWLDEWLKRQTTLQPSTLRRYALDVRQHISPLMGELLITDVTPQDIHEWLAAIQSRGLSPTSARHSLAVLRSALADAQRQGVVDLNSAQIVKPPRKAISVAGSMTRTEVSAVLSAAREQGEASELRWRLALIWGLRQGEVLGLQWQDFDQARRAIAIKRSLAYVPGEGLQFYVPKTAASVRWVPLDDRTVELFSRSIREPSEIVGTRTVFLTRTGNPIHPRNDYRRWSQLSERVLGRRLRLHDCRHVAVSLMLEKGLDPQTVSRVVGHSSLTMTLGTYGRAVPAARQNELRVWANDVA